MPKLPVLSGKKLLKILVKHGFVAVRRKGSHVFVECHDGKCGTVIPLHGNEDLGAGLLRSIFNDLDLTIEDVQQMMKV